jgi:hypothetical protein
MHNNFKELINENQVCCSIGKVVSENGKRFEVLANENFTKLRIDNCLIKSNLIEKCDFGIIRHSNGEFYFIELKGGNVQKAFNQIVSTINFFQENLKHIPKENRFGFIISSKVPKAGVSANTLKQEFAKKYGRILEIKNKDFRYIPK